MYDNKDEEYEDFKQRTGVAEAINAHDQSTIRKVATGVAKGVGDVVSGVFLGGTRELGIQVTDFAYDVGAMVEFGLGRAFAWSETAEETREKVQQRDKELRDWRDRNFDYLDTLTDENSQMQAFARDFTTSVLKFGIIWSKLPKEGMSVTKKAAIAGAGEGATDSTEKELIVIDNLLIKMAGAFGEENARAVTNYLDLSQDRSMTQKGLHRALSAIEVAILSSGVEKAVNKLGPVVSAGAGAVKEVVGGAAASAANKVSAAIPDSAKLKMVDGMMTLLEKQRRAKEWIAKKAKGGTMDFKTYVDNQTGDTVDVVGGQLKFGFNGQDVIDSAETYGKKHQVLESRLAAVAHHLDEKVVNLRKARGISDQEALEELLGAAGRGLNKVFKTEGHKGVLKVVASNALLDQETIKVTMVLSGRAAGQATPDQVRNAVKGYLIAGEQREAMLKAPAQTMVAARGAMGGTKEIFSELKDKAGGLINSMKQFGGDLDNPAFLDDMADTLENIMAKNQILGKSEDEVIQALLTQVDLTVKGKGTAREFLESVSSMYQANLLSALPTLSQNTIGSFSRGVLHLFETGLEATWSKAIGRQAGDATFREAWIATKSQSVNALLGVVGTARAAVRLAKGDFKGAYRQALHEMKDIPEMSKAQHAKMFRPTRQDFSPDVGIKGLPAAAARGVAAPIMGAINLQDTVQRAISARSALTSKFDTAIYTDNILGIGEDVLKDGKASKVIEKLWKDQTYKLLDEDIAALGIPKEDAGLILGRLADFRERASREARKVADEAVFQTPLPLHSTMSDIGTILQERILWGAGRVFTPFFTTPVNIMTDTLKRLPLVQFGSEGAMGLPIHPQFYKDFKAGGAKQKKALAKLSGGIALTQYFMDLADEGHLQYVPSGRGQAEGLQGTLGIGAGSVVYKGKSYSTATGGPIGLVMNFAAYLHHKREQIETGLTAAPESVAEAIRDGIYLNLVNFAYAIKEQPAFMAIDQIATVLETRQEDEGAGEALGKFFAQKAGSFVPYSSLQRNIYNNFEGDRVLAEGLDDHFKNVFAPYGGIRARNAWGETMGTTGGWLLRSSDVKDDEIAVKSLMLGVHLKNVKIEQVFPGRRGEPSARVALTREEYDRLGEILMDIDIKGEVGHLLNSEEFRSNMSLGISQGQRRNRTLVQSKIDAMHREAAQVLLSEQIDLQVRVENARKKGYDLEKYYGTTPAGKPPTFGGN